MSEEDQSLEGKLERLSLELQKNITDHVHREHIYIEDRLKVFEETIGSVISTYVDQKILKGKQTVQQQTFKGQNETSKSEIESSTSAVRSRKTLVSWPWAFVDELIQDTQYPQLTDGKNGAVFLRYWEGAQLRVVVKLFDTRKYNENESYESELSVISKVTHPNWIGTLAVAAGPRNHPDEDKRAIVYRFAELGSLQDHIGELRWEQVLSVFKGVVAGLGAIHELGFTHRDIKPPNILLDSGYEAKLADFGSTKLDQTEFYSGTAGYVDRELLKGITTYRPWHDMYSLGITMLQTLCNWKLPFTQSGSMETIYGWMDEETTQGRSIICEQLKMTGCNEEMESKIVEVTRTLFAKESSTRPTAQEFGAMLSQIEDQYLNTQSKERPRAQDMKREEDARDDNNNKAQKADTSKRSKRNRLRKMLLKPLRKKNKSGRSSG